MVKYCPECGKKVNPTDKYCKECGATLVESVKVKEKESKFEKKESEVQKPPASVKPPTKYVVRDIVKACIQIFIVVMVLYFVWYSYNCAVGNYPNTGDQMCKSIYQFFSGKETNGDGDRDKQVSIGCQHCSPGYCWTGTVCCPSYAQYYCNGKCYRSSGDAYNAGCHQSSWTRWCC